MDPTDLLGALVRGAFRAKPRKRAARALRYLTGRGKGSFGSASTVLTAAGVAWGVYDTWRSNQARPTGPPAPARPAAPLTVPPAALRLVRLTISAARADGTLGDAERAAIVEEARPAGADVVVEQELARASSLDGIVEGVTDAQEKADLYTLAFSIVRADESVSGAERIYLARLAALLGLDAATTTRLEQDAAGRIDAPDAEN